MDAADYGLMLRVLVDPNTSQEDADYIVERMTEDD